MCATLAKGYVFGATESVTNTKLHLLVDSGSVGAISNADIANDASIADSKLASISTAGKVSGAAITTLTSVPSGAGIIPVANLGSGTGSSSNFLRGDGAWTAIVTPPTGSITMWGGALASPPTGWLVCDGSEASQTTYAALYAICGTIWGAGGTGTFTLPNFTNRFPYGANIGSSAGNADVGSAGAGNALSGNDTLVKILSTTAMTEGDSGSQHPSNWKKTESVMPPYLAVGYIIKT